MQTESLLDICSTCDIEPGAMLPFEIDGHRLVVYRLGEQFFVTDNVCPHGFALLSDGWLEEYEVECPLHGALFDIRNGAVTRGPAECGIKTYPASVVKGRVCLTMAPR